MKLRAFAWVLILAGLLTAGCASDSSYKMYHDASNDLFIKANQCAAAELIRYLLADQANKYEHLGERCVERGWRGNVALGGYGQPIGFHGHVQPGLHSVHPPSTLMIASLANLDQLNRSSRLGRVISEQVSATFTRAGYRMRELKLGSNVYIRSQGELILTREVRELARTHAAQAIIVGTYTTSREFLYVNLKVVHPQENVVLAAHDYTLPLDRNVRIMLAN